MTILNECEKNGKVRGLAPCWLSSSNFSVWRPLSFVFCLEVLLGSLISLSVEMLIFVVAIFNYFIMICVYSNVKTMYVCNLSWRLCVS